MRLFIYSGFRKHPCRSAGLILNGVVGFVLIVLVASCNNATKSSAQQESNHQQSGEDKQLIEDRQLIVGKWHAEDKQSGVSFTKDECTFYSPNLKETFRYELSYKSCETEDSAGGDTEYLVLIDSDGGRDCYSVSALDKHNLAMQYLSGNGTTSVYTR